MNSDDLDRILDNAGRTSPDATAQASIAHVECTVLSDLHPVRPLAPLWIYISLFLVLFVVVGGAAGLILGLHGLHVLTISQFILISITLFAVASIASAACAREMTPIGSQLSAFSLIAAALAFPALFSLIFRGYGTTSFVSQGIPCLVAGLCVAIPAALLISFLLRRGFVMQWSMAGLAAGTLSGLTGLAMLELHCPNLKAIHVMVWHVAVVIVSGILGFVIGRFADHLRRNSI